MGKIDKIYVVATVSNVLAKVAIIDGDTNNKEAIPVGIDEASLYMYLLLLEQVCDK
jgi:hypothetical protein